jgi:hypothetical protein
MDNARGSRAEPTSLDGLWRDHPDSEEALVELTLGRRALEIWVFVAEAMDEFMLRLDVLRAYNASVDLGRHMPQLGQEEVTLWRPGAQSTSSRFSPVCDEVITALCEKVVMVTLEIPLGAANVLIEPSQKSSRDRVYIAKTLVRARPSTSPHHECDQSGPGSE